MNKIVTTVTTVLTTTVLMLGLWGCTGADTIKLLQVTVDAAGVALPIIAATGGVPPALVAPLEAYLQGVNVAIGQASTILAGPGTPGQKRAEILAAFASVAVPLLPAGLPVGIANAIQAVANDVAKFLANVSAPIPGERLAHAMTPPDEHARLMLAGIAAKAKVNLTALAARQSAH